MPRASQRGIQRERDVREVLEDDGWWVCRAAGSLGDADLVALHELRVPRLIEVKSTAAGPYAAFGPKDRRELEDAATRAGAEAWLAFWPPRGVLMWIPSWEWPEAKSPKRRTAQGSCDRVLKGEERGDRLAA